MSVVVQGRVYVGGGYAGNASMDNYMIMEYDIGSGHWTKLPPYRFRNFAMTVIHNELVLVGGQGQVQGQYSKMLGVWRAESQEWTLNFPEMLTARSSCSAVVYNEWLVVAGGEEGQMSSVDVMNTGTKQWFAGSPTPSRWRGMKTASIGDTCFFMGGSCIGGKIRYATAEVYSVSLPALISQICSLDSMGANKQQLIQIWKEIPQLHTVLSSPLSIGGCLLAVGGRHKDCAVTTIQLYQPDAGEWVKVGDLPTPRSQCTCAMVTDREMIVAGGFSGADKILRLDFALIT